VAAAAANYSEHPIRPLSEIEVFVGFLLNRVGGTQTARQRESSHKLRDEFERLSAETDGLEMAMACLDVGFESWTNHAVYGYRRRGAEFDSFKILAGAVVLAELKRLEQDQAAGGYVGVDSAPMPATTPQDSGGSSSLGNGASVLAQVYGRR
jgi:hypothetical protein